MLAAPLHAQPDWISGGVSIEHTQHIASAMLPTRRSFVLACVARKAKSKSGIGPGMIRSAIVCDPVRSRCFPPSLLGPLSLFYPPFFATPCGLPKR